MSYHPEMLIYPSQIDFLAELIHQKLTQVATA